MTPSRADRRAWTGLAVLALPTLIIGLDLTVLHLAAPKIAADLDPGPIANLWIIDVYGFAVAGLLLTMGGVGDRIGRRRLLMIGAVGFAVASVVAAFSTSAGMLIAARALLGVAGATLMPSTLSLIRDLFADDRERTVAISIWMASLMGGSALGPLVGGALLEFFWWGSVFLISVPVMVGLLIAGPILLPEGKPTTRPPIDLPSVLLSFLVTFPLAYAVKDTAAHGAGPVPGVLAVGGCVAGVAFVRRQQRLASPMLDVNLFRSGLFSASVATHFWALAANAGLQYLMALYLQIALGYDPLAAGLWTLPAAAAGLVGAVSAGYLTRFKAPMTVITAGLALGASGTAIIIATPTDDGLPVALTGFALTSFSISLVTALTTDIVIRAAPSARAGMASGVTETAAEMGIATGMALLGSVATAVVAGRTNAPLSPTANDPALADALTDGLKLSAAAATAVLVVLTAVCMRRSHRPAPDDVPAITT